MSRAHVQGFDSNPAQFERMGNPWLTPREQQELGNSPVSRKLKKQNARLRPCQLEYRDIQRIARELTPEEAERKRHRDTLWQIRRLDKRVRLEEDLSAAMPPPPEPPVKVIATTRNRPLSPSDYAKRSWQRFNAVAKRLEAERAFRISKAGRDAEHARLVALRKALDARIAKLER